MPSFCPFYPFEINGQKYLICKLPNQLYSTLHDPATKQIVGQWNNTAAQYEIFPFPLGQVQTMTDEQFDQHMRQLITSGIAFAFS